MTCQAIKNGSCDSLCISRPWLRHEWNLTFVPLFTLLRYNGGRLSLPSFWGGFWRQARLQWENAIFFWKIRRVTMVKGFLFIGGPGNTSLAVLGSIGESKILGDFTPGSVRKDVCLLFLLKKKGGDDVFSWKVNFWGEDVRRPWGRGLALWAEELICTLTGNTCLSCSFSGTLSRGLRSPS